MPTGRDEIYAECRSVMAAAARRHLPMWYHRTTSDYATQDFRKEAPRQGGTLQCGAIRNQVDTFPCRVRHDDVS